MCSYVPLDKVGILTSVSAFSSARLIKDRAFFVYKINLSWLIKLVCTPDTKVSTSWTWICSIVIIANEWVLKHKTASFFTFFLNIACVAAAHALVNIRVRQGLERLRRRQS